MGAHRCLEKVGMASMQSQRTQCCCCAVGVFAAMFGIFMLSAGICIVLNVNYMEVDTSGLPPELHNEEGKKVVGIILICVALGALGVSATVSIVYFAICNRKPPPKPPVEVKQQQSQLNHGTLQSGERTPVNGTLNRHQNFVNSRSAQNSNQPSTSRGPTLSSNSDGPSRAIPMPVHGRTSPMRTTRHKARSRAHRHQNRTFRPGLQPHQEEETEAASNVNGIKSQTPEETDSVSGSSATPSRAEAQSTDFLRTPPQIVVNAWTGNPSTQNGIADTQFYEGIDFHGDSRMNTSNEHTIFEGNGHGSELLNSDLHMGSDPLNIDSPPHLVHHISTKDLDHETTSQDTNAVHDSMPMKYFQPVINVSSRQSVISSNRLNDDQEGMLPTDQLDSSRENMESRMSYSSVMSNDSEGMKDIEEIREKMAQLLQDTQP